LHVVADFSNPDFFYHALIAVGVGALVGLEREHHRDEVSILAGVRTFSLISLFGFLCSDLSLQHNDLNWLVIMGAALIGAYGLFLAYIKFQKGSPGLTTPIALAVTYAAGVMVGYDLLFEAAVVTVVTTFLLISRRRTHRLAAILDDDELIGALQFLTIVVILYPLTYFLQLLPPLDMLNRHGLLDLNYILSLVVFVSGISFISFIIVRKEGAKRGLEFSGLLGGMVNSAATTASLCNLVKGRKDLMNNAVAGIMLATGVMMVRNLIIIAVAEPDMKVAVLVLPFLTIGAAVAFILGLLQKGGDGDNTKVEMKSPFAIWPAIKFAGLIVILSVVTYGADKYLGQDGVYFSAIAGLVSSAAVAASLAGLVLAGNVEPMVAAQTLMLASTFSCIGNLLITRSVSKEMQNAVSKKMYVLIGVGLACTLALFLI